MAGENGYSVGNLKIAFNALDQTSADFKELSKNLRAIVNLINKISTADLGKFTANVKAITKAFNPFLTKINQSTTGLQAFNNVAKQIGVNNISNVAYELGEIGKETKKLENSNLPAVYQEQSRAIATMTYSLSTFVNEQKEATQAAHDFTKEWLDFGLQYRMFDYASNSVSSLTSQIKNLIATQRNMGDFFDEKTNGLFSIEAEQRLTDLVNAYFQEQKVVDDTNEALRRMKMTEKELLVDDYRKIQAEKQKQIAYLEAVIAMGKAGDQTKEFTKELERLRGEQNKTEKATRKSTSGFSKFLKQIKRIAVYRLIRTALRKITQAFTESIQAFASVDDNINQTMSNITSSLSIIKLSLGTAILPILQIIEPIIQQIAIGLANVANLIGQAMSKTGTYTKININAWKDYRKELNKTQGALFDFDKFRALNNTNKSNLSDFLLPNQEVDENNEKVTKLRETFEKLSIVFKKVVDIVSTVGSTAFGVFLDILDKVLDIITPIISGISKFINKLNELGLLKPIIEGIAYALLAVGAVKVVKGLINVASAIKGITTTVMNFSGTVGGLITAIALLAVGLYNTIKNWDKMSAGAKALSVVVLGLVAAFTALAIAKAYAKNLAYGIAMTVATAGAIAAAIAMGASAKNQVAAFANGGMPDKGTLFVAGEAGAEMVYNMPSGQSGVANVQQIAQAVYQGTYQATMDWWKSARNEIGGDVYLDGEKIYQSVGRTASKHGKRFADVR